MNKYEGGSFEDFLAEEGILEEVTERALKRSLILEIEDIVNAANVNGIKSFDTMSADLIQLNHYLFDLDNALITSELLNQFMLEATEMNTNPVHLNDHLFNSEDLLNRLLRKEVAA